MPCLRRRLLPFSRRRPSFLFPITAQQHLAVTGLTHFGFGAAAGALYALHEEKVSGPPVVKGMVFGTLIWLTWYLGLWPLFRVLKPATQHPARRNALMIVSHLIWGAALDALVRRGNGNVRR